MDPLTLLVFILAFGGMVIIHEFGHFIVARMCNVEVEEFGIGLPTPGALTYWTSKGYLMLKDGRRVEIPSNFKIPFAWNELLERDVKLTVDHVDDKLVLRTVEYTKAVKSVPVQNDPLASGHLYVDQNGAVVHNENQNQSNVSNEIVKVGKERGLLEITTPIASVHPGTRFTINWLPLGGFVRPKGENDPTIEGGLAAASPWKRLAVLVAGPAMNLIAAVVIFSLIINISGGIMTVSADTENGQVLITNVMKGSPAQQAGMQIGDMLVSAAGQPIKGSDDIRNIVTANVDKPVTFVVQRNGQQLDLNITPKYDATEGRPLIGIEYCAGCAFKPITSVGENLQTSLRYTGVQIYQLITLPVRMIRGTLPSEQGRVIGLKGIYDIMKQSVANDVQASQSSSSSAGGAASANPYNRPVQTLLLIAALSISLGVFNLFPFPALDGGRIIFVLPELLIRRRVPAKFENLVHALGMTILLLFMLYVNIMDFVRPVSLP
jgi:regulator of sigma E protease